MPTTYNADARRPATAPTDSTVHPPPQWTTPPPPRKLIMLNVWPPTATWTLKLRTLPSPRMRMRQTSPSPSQHQTHVSPLRRRPTLQSPAIATLPQNLLPPKSFHITLTPQRTPVYGTETSRRHPCSAPTNSLTAILTTSHVPLNA